MGKPYQRELDELPATYSWALASDIDPLTALLRPLADRPLIAVGSGGSLSVANLACWLHEMHSGCVSRTCTPLEMTEREASASGSGVLLLSASGKNPDILAALRESVRLEPDWLSVICGAAGTPLARVARTIDRASVVEYLMPSGKDGFLATNSLIGFATLLLRAFAYPSDQLPLTFEELLGHRDTMSFLAGRSEGDLSDLVRRETLIVLYSAATKTAALDLESKLTEAALGRVQMSDFRNFAHGRHHWLAKRADETAVLALTTPPFDSLCARTIELLPEGVPKVMVRFPASGTRAALQALIYATGLVKLIGDSRGIDPGRPGVPDFGRRIYHLRQPKKPKRASSIAAWRKLHAMGAARNLENLSYWNAAQLAHLHNLRSQNFDTVIFDYDGTLCSPAERFVGPGKGITAGLNRLLDAGLYIGIATGRGRSARRDLALRIHRHQWDRVLLAYYNGAEIGHLGMENCPDATESPAGDFSLALDALAADTQLRNACTFSVRPRQITLEARSDISGDRIWMLATECLRRASLEHIRVVTSTHSVDVLASGTTKLNLLRYLSSARQSSPSGILCVGDRGRWPGNDFELLSHQFSLSVDDVSLDPGSCWNHAPAGCRGTAATRYYMAAMRTGPRGFRLCLPLCE